MKIISFREESLKAASRIEMAVLFLSLYTNGAFTL